VAIWGLPWQKGGPHCRHSFYPQAFAYMGPPNMKAFPLVSPRHPVPAGRTTRATREDVRRSRTLDHADRCRRGHMRRTNLPGHSPYDVLVLERALRATGVVARNFREPAARTVKKLASSLESLQDTFFRSFLRATSRIMVSGDKDDNKASEPSWHRKHQRQGIISRGIARARSGCPLDLQPA
jgi:hypothetical protein